MNRKKIVAGLVLAALSPLNIFLSGQSFAGGVMSDYTSMPPFLAKEGPPLVMLVMGRNHKLYYEAYNDASDLNEDGAIDVGYKPAVIDYYGYFDSYKCYVYDSGQTRFEPNSVSADKTCGGATEWSGDFLNYLTMSRMDTLRKVLFGGYRSTDTATETVLQRVYVPQDAHTWGKEYASVAHDGYDISDYTPLALPGVGLRHLFASTTLANNGTPIIRVLPNNTHRIWEWVAKEGPVADGSLVSAGGSYTGSPANHSAYESLVAQYATASHLQGSSASANGRIDGSGNPFGPDEYYLTIFAGKINVTTAGNYSFAVDGDDAVEVIIGGTVVAGYYGPHGTCDTSPASSPFCTTYQGTINLSAGLHTIEYRHQEASGGDSYYLYWRGADSSNAWQIVPTAKYADLTQTVYDVITPASTITDYDVQVVVCDSTMLETNCQEYPDGNYKPVGILQRHGESGNMNFGLLTGSYSKNTSGGVLRKNVGPITDEINISTNGTLTAVNGIINTINKFRITEFNYASYNYLPGWSGAWLTDRAMNEGEFPDWGNPIGEMMYETLRYFAGAASPSTAFHAATMADDNAIGLPNATWINPYHKEDLDGDGVLDAGEDTNGNGKLDGFEECQKPFMLVLSDINPTYDSDQVPGSHFGTMAAETIGNAATALDVDTLLNTISDDEGISGSYYVGDAGGTFDTNCTAKSINTGASDGLGDVRGLCPEEPTKRGSYSSAAVAHYGRTEDLHSADSEQSVLTYAVALASPLPRIEIPIGNPSKTITLVPFAKSVGGCLGLAPGNAFLPTNTIVDFFVDTIDPANPTYGKFRINFEDVEQAADHDMDAIVEYEYQVYEADGTTEAATPADGAMVKITLTSTYAAGCVIQHVGYIISGTTDDGTKLVVRDFDTGAGSDVNYALDTPNVAGDLPLTATSTFSPGVTTAATLLENPLYYAAKWGGFEDFDGNNKPDDDAEWDKDGDGVPDTYFYVVNPLKLEQQLNKSFASILMRTSSGTAASVISNSRSGEGAIYQAVFYPTQFDSALREVTWAGDVHSLWLDDYGNIREDCGASTCGNPCDPLTCPNDNVLDLKVDQILEFYSDTATNEARVRRFKDLDPTGLIVDGDGVYDNTPDVSNPAFVTENILLRDIRYLWSAGQQLAETASAQKTYGDINPSDGRYIFTSFNGSTAVPFTTADLTSTLPAVQYLAYFNASTATEADKIVNYIRGQDQTGYRSRQIDWDNDGTAETYKLGDIIHSTPTVVAAPAEGYDVIYNDESYRQFRLQYNNRRTMIYAGGNDGGLHAFNGGYYDRSANEFIKAPSGLVQYELGSEMWMFVPKNVLPHLKWLTDPSYSHVYYIDLKPYIFDAKIFDPADPDHPDGWGTVLVGGMRFGGGDFDIGIDMDSDGSNDLMRSSYFIMDITNPENPPQLLAEFTDPNLGFTTGAPSAIPMLRCDKFKKDPELSSCEVKGWNMDWYLAFGSGPHDGTFPPDEAYLGRSDQDARLYVMALGGTNDNLGYVTATPPALLGGFPKLLGAGHSFFSDFITVDSDLSYQPENLYFGSVENANLSDHDLHTGGVLRLVIDNDFTSTAAVRLATKLNPANWFLNTFYDAGQPVVAAPSVAYDGNRQWVYFGTGRFFSAGADKDLSAQQTYYGIKERYDYDATVGDFLKLDLPSGTNIVDVSNVWVKEFGQVWDALDSVWVTKPGVLSASVSAASTGVLAAETFDELNHEMSELTGVLDKYHGWKLDFDLSGERNLGQAAIIGNIVTFTTYVPSASFCDPEGDSYLWAPFYRTGTAYKKSVIGLVNNGGFNEVLRKEGLGKGLATTPNIHSGAEDGSKAFVQTSTGAIIGIEQKNPGVVKSGLESWREIINKKE